MLITFKELREFKDSLPDGTMQKIAKELKIEVETVRNYFGGSNYINGKAVGIHIEEGLDGGIVMLEDTKILKMAQDILKKEN